jgi:hypothetical protein
MVKGGRLAEVRTGRKEGKNGTTIFADYTHYAD